LCVAILEYKEGPLANIISVPKVLGNEHVLIIEALTVSSVYVK